MTVCLVFSCPTGKEKMDNKMKKKAWWPAPKWLSTTFTPCIHTSASVQSPCTLHRADRCSQQGGVEWRSVTSKAWSHNTWQLQVCFAFFPFFFYLPFSPSFHPSLTWLWGTSATMSQEHPRWPTVRPCGKELRLLCQWPCDWATVKVNPPPSAEPLADIWPATPWQILSRRHSDKPLPVHRNCEMIGACSFQLAGFGVIGYAAIDNEYRRYLKNNSERYWDGRRAKTAACSSSNFQE